MSRRFTAGNRWVIQLTVALIFSFSSPNGTGVAEAREQAQTDPNETTTDTLSSGVFSVLTYNIAGLPEFISSARTRRAPSIEQIGRILNQFDVVHVQEDFNYNKNLYYSGNSHPYRTTSKGKVPFGDGLNTLSRYPVDQLMRIPWTHCTGADCLTPKGFTFSRLRIAKNTCIDFYNVHTNAYNHKAAAAARRENIRQLCTFIQRKSQGQAVIIMGDLNAHYGYQLDNLQELLQKNALKDAWLELYNQNNTPIQSSQLPDDNILNITGKVESIDKIIYRSSDQVTLKISDYQVQNALFSNAQHLPLSDHHPVSLVFNWQISKTPDITQTLVVAK